VNSVYQDSIVFTIKGADEMEKQDSSNFEKEVTDLTTDPILKNESLRKSLFSFTEKAKNELGLSETMSLYLHLPKRYIDNCDLLVSRKINAKEAISIALVVNQLDPFVKYSLILEIERLCYTYQYEGKWKICNTIIQLAEDVDKFYYFTEIEKISTRELFGNYLRILETAFSRINLRDRRKNKVKKPKRKRGYNDHGSRRPEHKWLPSEIWIGENPKRLDLRNINLKVNRETFQIEKKMKPEPHSQHYPRKEKMS
jgi:hypothetical protein